MRLLNIATHETTSTFFHIVDRIFENALTMSYKIQQTNALRENRDCFPIPFFPRHGGGVFSDGSEQRPDLEQRRALISTSKRELR